MPNASPSSQPSSQADSVYNAPSFVLKATAMLIGMFAFLQVYSIQSILPVLMVDLQATEVQVGMAVGATVMAVALMSPFLGMLSDAVGRKSIIVGSLLFLAVPTALIAGSNNIETVVFWRFLQGLSVPGITVVTIAYLGEEFKGSAIAGLMAYYVSGSVLGGFLGRFLLGHLHEQIGWRMGFYVMAGLTLAGALWVAKTLPASQHFIPSPKFRTALTTLSGHLTNRYVVASALLGFCVLFTLVGCFTFINLHLAHTPYELTTGQLANIFAVYLLGVIITPLSSKLIQRFGSARTILVAICISMLGVFITLSSPLWLIIAGLAIMSSGVFITQSATIGYIATNVSEGRSLASGLYYMGYYAGGTVGAWACGLAYTQGEWQATVILLVVMQVTALLIARFGMIKTPLH